MQSRQIHELADFPPTIENLTIFNKLELLIFNSLRVFVSHSELIFELAKREIRDRYAGQNLGLVWVVFHPLFLMAFYVFLFAFIFPARFGSTGNDMSGHSLHILAGLVPWLTFQEVLGKSTSVITSNTSLVKQIVFPIEVLPIKAVLAAFVSQVIATFVLLIFAVSVGQFKFFIFLLPILFLMQLMVMWGVCFLLSSLGAYFKDLRDFVQMFCTVNLFATPILYGPRELPEIIELVLTLNPFSWMIWCYQDVIYFGYIAHPWAWLAFGSSSVMVFLAGFALFSRVKHGLGNVL